MWSWLSLSFFLIFFGDGKRKHDGIDDEDRIIEDDVEMDEGEPNLDFCIFLLLILTFCKTSHIDQMLF
jgi:hypothetical protein